MKYKVGMYGGCFDPLHMGHLSIISKAAMECEKLYLVLSYCISRDFVYYKTRMQWLHKAIEQFDNIEIILLEDDCKTKDSYNNSNAWEIGAAYIKEKINKPIDVVYCGMYKHANICGKYKDDYYPPNELYKLLYPTAEICVVSRNAIPISSTEIRENLKDNWDFLPDFVKPYFVKKVLVVGGESTGKSTLVKTLAKHYNTNFVEEYGREKCIEVGGEKNLVDDDFRQIIFSHKVNMHRALMTSRQYLFIDTDGLTTWYFGRISGETAHTNFLSNKKIITALEQDENYDLVLFLEPTVPFVNDGVRIAERSNTAYKRKFNSDCLKTLIKDAYGDKVKYITGDYAERFSAALKEIGKL